MLKLDKSTALFHITQINEKWFWDRPQSGICGCSKPACQN